MKTDTQTLKVTTHAVLRFGQKVMHLPWLDNYFPSPSEHRQITETILQRISFSISIPTQLCLLFSTFKYKREARVAYKKAMQTLSLGGSRTGGHTVLGNFLYDGCACYVIENDTVVTIIVPDSEQLQSLEYGLEKARIEIPMPPAVEELTTDTSGIRFISRPIRSFPLGNVEICPTFIRTTSSLPSVEMLIEWIKRASPTPDHRSRVVTDASTRNLLPKLNAAFPNSLECIQLPWEFRSDNFQRHGYRTPGTEAVWSLLTVTPDQARCTFFICCRLTVEAVLTLACDSVQLKFDQDHTQPGNVLSITRNDDDDSFATFNLPQTEQPPELEGEHEFKRTFGP